MRKVAESTKQQPITAPPEWWQAFSDAATAEEKSLSAWVGDACLRRLPRDVRAALPRRRKPGVQPKNGEQK